MPQSGTFVDKEILKQLKSGDKEALWKLQLHCTKSVHAYISKNNGSTEDAEDILQDCMIAVWINIQKGDFKLSAKWNTYVMAIAKNLWLKRLKKNKRTVSGDENITYQNASFEVNKNDMDFSIITEYVQKLNETCRDLLIYFYFDGLDMSKIAHKMGFANSKTVKAKKYQCFKKLEHLVKENFTKSDFLNG